MEKFDLRELNKMVKSFRQSHRAVNKLRAKDEFEISFLGNYRQSGGVIPMIDEGKMREHLLSVLEGELSRLRKKFAEMGIDPIDMHPRKKKKADLKVAK